MSLLKKNLALGPALPSTSRRKVAFGTWTGPGDPSVYAMIDFEIAPALAYLEKLQKQNPDIRLTITHLIGKALAKVTSLHPHVNTVIRWGRIYPRTTIDVFFLAAADSDGKDLSGLTIRNTDKKSIPEIAGEMQHMVHDIRKNGDPAFNKMKETLRLVPPWIARILMKLTEIFTGTFNLWSPLLGTPRDAFGSIWITNIGSLGLDMAFAPLVPYSRVPFLVTLGAVREMPIVKDGQIVAAPILKVCATFDHRIIDGVYAAKMAKTLQRILADPEKELG